MTVFTRNDKAPDPVTAVKPAAEAPKPIQPEARPAMSQPITPSPLTQPRAASIISKALKITGQLESTEDIQIEGEVDGDVHAVYVKVGANAKVKGTVYGEQVELAGSVDGKIEAKKVILTRTAHMSGDVIHEDITIESGAYIDGHCRPEYGKTDTRPSKAAALAPEKTNGAGPKPAIAQQS
jgi:cytoskeletal protein CcmA (bactofilin family)